MVLNRAARPGPGSASLGPLVPARTSTTSYTPTAFAHARFSGTRAHVTRAGVSTRGRGRAERVDTQSPVVDGGFLTPGARAARIRTPAPAADSISRDVVTEVTLTTVSSDSSSHVIDSSRARSSTSLSSPFTLTTRLWARRARTHSLARALAGRRRALSVLAQLEHAHSSPSRFPSTRDRATEISNSDRDRIRRRRLGRRHDHDVIPRPRTRHDHGACVHAQGTPVRGSPRVRSPRFRIINCSCASTRTPGAPAWCVPAWRW